MEGTLRIEAWHPASQRWREIDTARSGSSPVPDGGIVLYPWSKFLRISPEYWQDRFDSRVGEGGRSSTELRVEEGLTS
jgi:hypothetical protein